MALGLPNILGGTAKQGLFGAPKNAPMMSEQSPMGYPRTPLSAGPIGTALNPMGSGSTSNVGSNSFPWWTSSGMANINKPKTAEAYGTPFKSEQQLTLDNDPVLALLRAQLGQFGTQNQLAQQQATAAQQQAQAIANWNRQQIQGQYGSDSALLGNERNRNVDLASQLANQLFGIQQEHYGATYDDLQRQLDQAAGTRDQYLQNSWALEDLNKRNRTLTDKEIKDLYGVDVDEYHAAVDYINKQRGFTGQEYDQGVQYSDALKDFYQRQYGEGTQYSNELRGYIGQQYNLAQDTSKEQDEQSRRKAKSEATTRGAMSSTGYGNTRQDLVDQLQLAFRGNALQRDQNLGGVNERDRGLALARDKGLTDVQQRNVELALNRDKTYASLSAQEKQAFSEVQRDRINANAGHDKAKLDYDQQQQGLKYGQQQATSQYDNFYGDVGYQFGELGRQQDAEDAAYNNQQQVFASMAKDYGIKQADLQRVMQQGISRIGMDFNSTMQQISQDYASGDASRRAQAAALQSQILQYGR